MNDRELLELAAKAAGLQLTWNPLMNSLSSPIIKYVDAYEYTEWNPLLDDGDAFRLAVKLGFTIKVASNAPIKNVACFKPNGGASVMESIAGCEYTATRRAIVRAAAEIGRAM